MMITPGHFRKVEQELRGLLNAGTPLDEALRLMHHERQAGLIFLWPAVMAIRDVDRKEAMRIVVRATAAWRSDERPSQ